MLIEPGERPATVRAPTPNSGAFRQEHVEVWFQSGSDAGKRFGPHGQERPVQEGCSVAVCTYARSKGLGQFLDSLRRQTRTPDQLIIVDASCDDATEMMLKGRGDLDQLAKHLLYFRVRGALRGLTRQRNFALRWVSGDLVAFFDDDVVLEPTCLNEMESVHRCHGPSVVGVGGYDLEAPNKASVLWRVRLMLGVVSNLRPGHYCRSGMSTPWGLLHPTTEAVEGDWLGGCSMMWRTEKAREVGFSESFSGYSQGEDLLFSLQMSRHGKLLLAGSARLRHLHHPSGRPDAFQLGYMAIYNRHYIHRHGLRNRRWPDTLWFVYAWGLDSLLLARHLLVPGKCLATARQLLGRCRAAYDIARGA